MKTCNYERFIVDYLEESLSNDQRCDFEVHLQSCSSCPNEVLRLRKLYELLSDDPVVAPEPKYWRELQDRIRIETAVTRPILMPSRRFAWWKLVPVLAPVLAVLAIFVFHRPDQKTVSIPVSLDNVIQGTDLSHRLLGRIVDENLVKSMNQIEPYYETEFDEVITNLNDAEKEELINKISEQYVGKI